jgi:hypothetical protein
VFDELSTRGFEQPAAKPSLSFIHFPSSCLHFPVSTFPVLPFIGEGVRDHLGTRGRPDDFAGVVDAFLPVSGEKKG